MSCLSLILLSGLIMAGLCRPCVAVAAERLKIAIVDFDAVNSEAKDEEWGRQIAEMLITAAVNGKAFDVVERHLVTKIMSEQSFGARETSFTSEAQSIGNMVGANYLLSGAIFKSRGKMRVDARMVDVASASIFVANSFLVSEDLADIGRGCDKFVRELAAKAYGGAQPAPAAPAASGVAAGFGAHFFLASKSGLVFTLNPGDELTAEESYYLTVDLPRTTHVYVAQIDARGDLYPIFPNPEFSSRSNPLPPAAGLRFPDKDFFFLDESTGKEHIYVLGFESANKALDECFAKAAAGDREAAATAFQSVADAVPAANRSTIWFWHR